jgi:hypothetical protein
LLNNPIYKIPRVQIFKKLIIKIHACSYIESFRTCAHHG